MILVAAAAIGELSVPSSVYSHSIAVRCAQMQAHPC
jgi:hypothetical protein